MYPWRLFETFQIINERVHIFQRTDSGRYTWTIEVEGYSIWPRAGVVGRYETPWGALSDALREIARVRGEASCWD